MSKLSTFTKDK